MLKRKPGERLGVNGPSEVQAHPWLKDFPWQQLMEKKLKAPFVPNVDFALTVQATQDNFDSRSINLEWKDNPEQVKESYLLLGQPSVQSLFNGYYFDYTVHTVAPVALHPKHTGKEQLSGSSQITAATTSIK